jgi:hypothetical protein
MTAVRHPWFKGALKAKRAPATDAPCRTWLLCQARDPRAETPTRATPAAGICDFVLDPRPPGLLLLGSFVCALAFCFSLFDVHFLLGTSDYWRAPRGVVGNSWADISTAISGYYYFVRDAWTLPLFQAARLGVPDGTNIIFTDSIPIVALFGRLVYDATGLVINPYGGWTALCFVGSALSMTGLVTTLGQRSIATAMMATVSGLCMPALLARWGHMSLMAQWEIPLALVIYFRSCVSQRAYRLVATSLLLASVTLWTHTYTFVMVVGILVAALAQAVLDRRLRLPQAAAIGALAAIVLLGLVLISGQLATRGSLAAPGFGTFSMNLLSPVVPQFSALFPVMGQQMVDATGGQYEGFSYLGAGVLLLVITTLPWLRRTLLRAWPGHTCILVLLVSFTLFAVSNQVYYGFQHVVTIPLPAPLLAIASMFRSSGRFFWPGLYLLTATAIVAAPLLWGRAGACLLIVATVVQFVDTGPLRSALATRIAAPGATPISDGRWAHAIGQHQFLRVLPAFGCLSDPNSLAAQTALQLQLLASRENVATNTVYAARHREDCTQEAASLAPQELRVYLLSAPQAGGPPNAAAGCATAATLAVCSRQLGATKLAPLLATRS